jgi:hypothetical protein
MFYILTPPGEAEVYPYTLTDLKRDNREVSFPSDMTNFDASDWYCYPVQDTPPPEAPGMVAVRIMPVQIDGVWYEQWELEPYTQEQIDAQWAVVREERNEKLAECDWTQLPDAPVDKAAWATYRQELRDITLQPDPFNIIWPTPP